MSKSYRWFEEEMIYHPLSDQTVFETHWSATENCISWSPMSFRISVLTTAWEKLRVLNVSILGTTTTTGSQEILRHITGN
jgi:hypothetical protein